MKRAFLYFFIAALPVAIQPEEIPQDEWQWFKLIGGAMLAGFTALKALQSPNGT